MATTETVESNETYHADTSCVSASMLKALAESPRIFEGQYITRTIKREPSPSMAIGTAIHCAALEPNRFCQEYVECPSECSDRRTKKYKEWSAGVDGQEILTAGDAEIVRQCSSALRSNQIVGMSLEAAGVCEQSYRWQESGVQLKMRADKICPDAKIVLDIKTISKATQGMFAKQVADFGYHIQQSHYLAGARDAFGDDGKTSWMFVFAVVETCAPYRCRAFQLDRDASLRGEERRFELLSEYARRMESGDWSEDGEQELVEVSLPKWF